MQEDEIALPFLGAQVRVGPGFELVRQARQFVIVGGEDRAALVGFVQVLGHSPGDGETIERGGAAADFIEHNERARSRLVQDGRGFDHLGHERRAAPREIVGRADAGKHAIDDAEPQLARRHIRARLRQHSEQRDLAQICALARHVRAGDHHQARTGFSFRIEPRVVRRETLALTADAFFHHRMARAFGEQRGGFINLGTRGLGFFRPLGKASGNVKRGERFGGCADRRFSSGGASGELFEERQLARQRGFAGTGDLRVEFGKFRRREADRTGIGLAMDEARAERRRHQGFGLLGCRVYVIAQHVVVLELKPSDAGLLRVGRLQRGDDFAAIVAEGARIVQSCVVTGRDKAAIARKQRQIRRERARQRLRECCAFGVDAEGERAASARDFLRRCR